ncbi:uncharacterized protein BDV14DRAFT_174040 [Aspergillus stella-maris]|uniref:uncharacterized protein n=1 Tax=Aspergillus stella-maris TaxID=1810926 RepID=UPI003CCD22BF
MFKSVTENIIKYSANEIEFHGLPIPETITAALNHERNTHIATILSPLQQLQKDLAASGWRACRSRFVVGYQPAESCTYMVLGSLTAHLYSLGLTMPEPAPAYPGVAAYELLGYCHEKMVSSSHNTIGEIDRVTPCGLGQRVCAALDTVRGLRGLDIDDPRFGRRRDTPGSQDLSDPDEEL